MSYLWHLELVNLMVARDLGTRNVTLYFFWTRIIRITRMFFGTRISLYGFFALDVWTRDFFWTRILRITRILFGTRISRISRILSLRLVVNDSSLWLLTRCGYWLVVVIGLLWLLTCCVLNDKSKKISVSHAKHWQIREIREIRVRNKYIRAIRSSCERTAANKDLWDPCA